MNLTEWQRAEPRRTIPATGELIRALTLPRPFSVNAMRNRGHKSARDYKAWQDQARRQVMAQGPRLLIPGPVFIDLIFPAGSCSRACDTDNQAKCILDVLVTMGILADDNRAEVPMQLLRWGPGDETEVRIFRFLGEVL